METRAWASPAVPDVVIETYQRDTSPSIIVNIRPTVRGGPRQLFLILEVHNYACFDTVSISCLFVMPMASVAVFPTMSTIVMTPLVFSFSFSFSMRMTDETAMRLAGLYFAITSPLERAMHGS